MAPTILDLPLDVQQHVLRFLRPHELCPVRLVCRELSAVASMICRVLGRHGARVWTVCVNEALDRAYTASDDGTAVEWEVGTTRSRRLRTWTAASPEVGCKSAASVETRLYIGLGSGEIQEYDLEAEGAAGPLRVLAGHTKAVGALLVAGGRLVSAGDDNAVRVWDRRSGEQLHALKAHYAYVRALAWDGAARLFSGSLDKTIIEWDLETGQKVRALPRRGASVAGLLVHGGRLYSTSGPLVQEWDLARGDVARTFEGHDYYCRGLAAVGESLYSAGGNEILEWDLRTGARMRRWAGAGHDESRYAGHGGPVYAVAVSGAFLVSASEDTSVRLWMRW
eukprot:tig00000821_g4485.t1